MANFQISNKLTGGNEGGYSNDVNDKGGETFAGIARNYWPKWSGWRIIDDYKAKNGLHNINSLLHVPVIRADIDSFYKTNFWDVNKLDQINDQQIADTVYDFGVNSGVGTAAKMLQRVVGVSVDGVIGSGTLAAVNGGNAKQIHDDYNAARKAYYLNIIANNPSQVQFKNSWLSRLVPYKS